MSGEWQIVGKKNRPVQRSEIIVAPRGLCSTCNAIFRTNLNTDLGVYNYKVHHSSPQALYVASKQCRICKEVWTASQSYLQERAERQKAHKYGQSNSVVFTIHELEDVVETMPRAYDAFDPPRQDLKSTKTWLQLTFSWNG